MREWLPPYRVELAMHGSEWGDFAYNGYEFLVSARAVAVLSAAGLTGLPRPEPVEAAAVTGSVVPPPSYYWMPVARTATAIDEDKSAVTRPGDDPYCSYCGDDVDSIEGFVVDLATWSGDDLFRARNLRAEPKPVA